MLGLLQEFLAWLWSAGAWLNTGERWAILVSVVGLGLLYLAFKHRR